MRSAVPYLPRLPAMSFVCHDLSPPAVRTCALETARGLMPSKFKDQQKMLSRFRAGMFRTATFRTRQFRTRTFRLRTYRTSLAAYISLWRTHTPRLSTVHPNYVLPPRRCTSSINNTYDQTRIVLPCRWLPRQRYLLGVSRLSLMFLFCNVTYLKLHTTVEKDDNRGRKG